jgi:two-component system, cell cycle sensor histidine kinase and response regulator CckA
VRSAVALPHRVLMFRRSPPAILIVDDEPSNRIVAHRVLGGAGYDVTSAGIASEALFMVEERGPFDLYVLDVLMPTLRGTELANRIREIDPDARVLYFTAFAPELSHAPAPGLSEREAVLQKPVSNRELLQAVSMMVFGHERGPG